MPRAVSGVPRHRRTRKLMKRAKGLQGGRRKQYRAAKETLQKAGKYAFHGRKIKKRDFRALWIVRLAAAAKANGLSYSKMIGALKKLNIVLDRRVLAEIAVNDPGAFAKLAAAAKEIPGVAKKPKAAAAVS